MGNAIGMGPKVKEEDPDQQDIDANGDLNYKQFSRY
jgi:hypothetical protein